jgi:peptidylprolyl isomerase
MMMEGLQIVKRAIANEIFKFVTKLEKVNFIDSYNKPKPAEQKPAEAKPAEPKAA